MYWRGAARAPWAGVTARGAIACLLALALLPVAARAGTSTAALSVGATVIRRDPRAPSPPRATASTRSAPAQRVPPPGSLRLEAAGEVRTTAPARR